MSAGGEPRAAAAATGGSPPAAGRQTHGGGRRCVAVVPAVGDGARRIASSEPPIRPGCEPRLLDDFVDQEPQRDSAHVCSCAALHLRGEYPQGAAEPLRQGAAVGPSVVAPFNTQQRPCYWTHDTYGVAWFHASLCRGRDYCETNRPLPPQSLPPPTYTPEAVGCDPTCGPRVGGHGGAVVLGPGGRTPPSVQSGVVALYRFACACWPFFRVGLRRCGLVAGIGGGTSRSARRGPEPPPPPPPSRPRAWNVSWCSRRRSDPGTSVPPCSPPRSTCCGCWRARRTLQASCPCRAPSRNATLLPCAQRGRSSLGPAAASQSGLPRTRSPRSRSSWSCGPRRRKPATSPAPPLGSGSRCRPSPPLCWCSARQRRNAL